MAVTGVGQALQRVRKAAIIAAKHRAAERHSCPAAAQLGQKKLTSISGALSQKPANGQAFGTASDSGAAESGRLE